MTQEGFPPPMTRVLLWDESAVAIQQLTHGPGEGPWKLYSLSWGWRAQEHPTHWAPLPALDDPRWVEERDGATAPWGVDVLVRGAKNRLYVASRHDRPTFSWTGGRPLDGSTGWMSLEAARECAVAFPAAYLALPTRCEIEQQARGQAVQVAAQDIVLAVINDGPTYARYFLPLCEGKKLQHSRYKIGFADNSPERLPLLRGLIRDIVVGYATKNELVETNIRAEACRIAADEILEYYLQHSKELT